MKSKLTAAVVMAAAGTLAALLGAPEARAADVGVSISISQPGVYGRIDIGQYPQPAVVVQQPVIIRQPRVVAVEPVYLWVPPGHRRNWAKHCGRYNACGVPVYFVQDGWYNEHVHPKKGKGHGKGHDRDDERGHGKGRGHDKRD